MDLRSSYSFVFEGPKFIDVSHFRPKPANTSAAWSLHLGFDMISLISPFSSIKKVVR